MAYVKSICLTVYGTRQVTRSVGETSRTDTFVRCRLQADTAADADELPTMGVMIEGLEDDLIVDAGSRIDVLESSKTYTMGQDLAWHEKGGAVG